MKNKVLRQVAVVLIAAILLTGSVVWAGALTSNDNDPLLNATSEDAYTYTNPDTQYRAMIFDDLGLLTRSEQKQLLEDMKPITQFGNAAFWTTKDYAGNEIEQARLKRKELFAYQSACVFVINMNIRKLTIQSYGKIYEHITDSKARSITDNVSKHATNRNYYTCAKQAFEEIHTLLKGGQISEPMKVTSYAVFALLLGIILTLFVVFSKKRNPLQEETDATEAVKCAGPLFISAPKAVYVSSTTVHRVSSSGGGGGGGGGCGGGGGGCGGGGSSSF